MSRSSPRPPRRQSAWLALALASVASSAGACRKAPSAPGEPTLRGPDAGETVTLAWTEARLRDRLLLAQREVMPLITSLEAQPAAPGMDLVGFCGASPARSGPSAAALDASAGRHLADAALGCFLQAYWGCRIGDRIGDVQGMREERGERLLHAGARIQILEQSADRVVADVDMLEERCVDEATGEITREPGCDEEPPAAIRHELRKGADGVWRIAASGTCKAVQPMAVAPDFKLAVASGEGPVRKAPGESAGGPTLLEWSAAKGASARYEAPTPVLVDAVSLVFQLAECSGELAGARVELDDGERFELAAHEVATTHRFASPRRVRSITLTPLAATGPICLGRFVVLTRSGTDAK